MVEIHVAVADVTGVQGLVRRLARLFDRGSVSYDGALSEVSIRSERESRSIVLVLDAVEAWLEEWDVGSARLSIGDRSYTMIGPFPVTSSS